MIPTQPTYEKLWDLLSGRLFRIPEYQRAYSWGKSQRRDLFHDITAISNKGDDETHFMATVVCLKRKKQTLGTDEYDVLEIVDGQQRLTTLIILLNALKIVMQENEKAESKLTREFRELLVKEEGNELLLLQTNHDTGTYFTRYLKDNDFQESTKSRTLADKQILSAIEDCTKFIEKWREEGKEYSELAAILKNRLYFLFHEVNDEKSVYTIFEVLNSRGLDVSWFDRLKSILMGNAFELSDHADSETIIADLHRIWAEVYRVIGLSQGLSTEALRFAATLRRPNKPSKPLSEEQAVKTLRDQAITAADIRDIAEWLLKVVEACEKVSGNNKLNAVTEVIQARLLAVALHLRQDIDESSKNELLRLWERIAFRIYGLHRKDARTSVGDFVRLAWEITNENTDVAEIEARLTEIGNEYSVSDGISNITKSNCYEGWENHLRYLLFTYEKFLSEKNAQKYSNEQWDRIWQSSASKSIEHILPQSSDVKEIHWLGNLTLLSPGLNSSLKDKPPKEKVNAYRNTGLSGAGAVADVIHESGWDRQRILEREEKMLAWIAGHWK